MTQLIDALTDKYPDIAVDLPQHERDALRLVSAVHDHRDRETWGGLTYWDQLTERVKLSRTGGPTLAHWWSTISQAMGVAPTKETVAMVTPIIARNDPQTLRTLADNTEWIITLARLANDTRRADRTAKTTEQELPL